METQLLVQRSVPTDKTVLISEACLICNVSRRTIYYWIKKGLVRTKKVGNTSRVYLGSITKDRIFVTKSKRGPKPKK